MGGKYYTNIVYVPYLVSNLVRHFDPFRSKDRQSVVEYCIFKVIYKLTIEIGVIEIKPVKFLGNKAEVWGDVLCPSS